MPTYVYMCGECDREWEEVHTIADRDNCELCSSCGGEGRKIITPFSAKVFRKRWFEGVDSQPVYVESDKQLKKVCEKNKCHVVTDDRTLRTYIRKLASHLPYLTIPCKAFAVCFALP